MAEFDAETMEIVRRLQSARMAVLSKQPFFGVLLMNFRMALDKTTSTSYTDGTRLSFNPDFLKSLSDTELELVMMHEVLHAALGHPFRVQADYEIDLYDLACDIVVNSNILQCLGGDVKRITIKQFGILPHKTPSGKEGYECTVEEVYDELMKASGRIKKKKRGAGQGSGKGSKSNSTSDSDKSDNDELDNSDEDDSSNDETDNDSDDDASDDEKSDSEEKEDEENEDGEEKEGEENDSDAAGAGGKGKGKSKKDGKGKGASLKSGNKGKSSKQKNNGSASGGTGVSDEEKTFNKPSLEDLIASVKANTKKLKEKYELPQNNIQAKIKVEIESDKDVVFDDHTFWQGDDEDKVNSSMWNDRIMRATDVVLEKEKSHVGFGGPPLCAVRLVKELREPAVDWRTLLNDFIQEEVNDYSFSPPDRRMDDSPFFLPDFNEKEDSVKNVWFLIDTSGSIGDEAISAAYSEIISAMDMFNKLEGLLSFTEVFVTEPIPFCSPEELLEIKPVGGGGNDFSEIFRFMQRNMMDNLPVSIVILTDGYDYYPEEEAALGVPVLWLINNKEAPEPPWGKFARFEIGKKESLK